MIIPKPAFDLSSFFVVVFLSLSYFQQGGCALIASTSWYSRHRCFVLHPQKINRQNVSNSPRLSLLNLGLRHIVKRRSSGRDDLETEVETALQIISNADKSNLLEVDELNATLHNNKRLVKSIISAPGDRASLLLRNSAILRHPTILNDLLQPNASIRSTKKWFIKFLRLASSDEKQIASKWPTFEKSINRLGRQRLQEWLQFFLSKSSLGFNRLQLKRLILSRPTLLQYKLSNIYATISFFTDELGFTRDECSSVVLSYPSVLMHSIDNRLRPTVEFLQIKIGGGKENWSSWKNIILSYPQLFSHSLEKTLLPKVDFLRGFDKSEIEKRLLVLNKSEVSQVVAKFPPTLWLSEENLISKLEFLTESLGLDENELRALVVSYPQVLGLSLENNLRPKMEFFLHPNTTIFHVPLREIYSREHDAVMNCGLSKRQLKEFVLYQPALLAYSLEKRLKPRIKHMQEHNISFFYSPKSIMSYTDKKFQLWMSTQVTTWSVSEG